MLYIFRLIITLIYSILVCVFGSIYCLFSPRNPKHVATFGHMFGRLAAQFCDLTLHGSNAGFTGIAGDQHLQSAVIQPQVLGTETVLFQLLGDQVILGDHQLLLVGVGAQLDDLHTVQQGSRDGIEGVCSGYEQHL